MNPRTRRAALQAIGAIAIAASVNALAHSYAGLYDWAVHHRLGGWQAMSWPAEIDVFLAVGELALYVAYLDGWPARQRLWPWATALTGLAVSVAGNIGHIQAGPGHTVILADRLTAATSPLAAFTGLSVGLLVVKMTRQPACAPSRGTVPAAPLALAGLPAGPEWSVRDSQLSGTAGETGDDLAGQGSDAPGREPRLLDAASAIYQDAAARGERLSQRMLARQLRGHGHRFPTSTCARSPTASASPKGRQRDQKVVTPRRTAWVSLRPAPSTNTRADGVEEISGIMTRFRHAASLPETLAAGFDAFEAIRQLARDCENRVPALFAAFMTTADAAVDGREAITIAPSLPQPGRAGCRTPRRSLSRPVTGPPAPTPRWPPGVSAS